jgi:hypothetical protein
MKQPMMRSRATRLTLGVAVCLALGAATSFVVTIEAAIADRRLALRAFDLRARDATARLNDLRMAQPAYVAAGQGVEFWLPKVEALTTAATAAIDELRRTATSANGREALMDASATIAHFASVDRRAREYLLAGDELMAGDVVFTEGAGTAEAGARQVETARLAEYLEFDRTEATDRRQAAFVAAAAAAFSALVVLLLAAARPRAPAVEGPVDQREGRPDERSRPEPDGSKQEAVSDSAAPRYSVPALKAAAELCTEFGRARDLPDFTKLLGRAATTMDASGVIVWLGSESGGELRPVLAHGYSPQALARIPPVPKSADNAAAAAYRSGALQIVLSRPGAASGAVVAPMLSTQGCIGAFSAEIKGGSETADSVQALAAIFAAQLAAVLSGSMTSGDEVAQTRSATA